MFTNRHLPENLRGARHQFALPVRFHGRETVAAQRRKTRVPAGVHGVVVGVVSKFTGLEDGALTGKRAVVEPQFVANHQADTTRRNGHTRSSSFPTDG